MPPDPKKNTGQTDLKKIQNIIKELSTQADELNEIDILNLLETERNANEKAKKSLEELIAEADQLLEHQETELQDEDLSQQEIEEINIKYEEFEKDQLEGLLTNKELEEFVQAYNNLQSELVTLKENDLINKNQITSFKDLICEIGTLKLLYEESIQKLQQQIKDLIVNNEEKYTQLKAQYDNLVKQLNNKILTAKSLEQKPTVIFENQLPDKHLENPITQSEESDMKGNLINFGSESEELPINTLKNPELPDSGFSGDSSGSSGTSSPSITPPPEDNLFYEASAHSTRMSLTDEFDPLLSNSHREVFEEERSPSTTFADGHMPITQQAQDPSGIGTALALKKLQNNDSLTEADLKNLDPVLQYTDNEDEFSLALQAIYQPSTPIKVSRELFIKTRSQLRKNTLNIIEEIYPYSNEIDEIESINVVNGKAWLKIIYQLISGNSNDLKLTNTAKKELAEKLHLSPLELAAVTHKSIAELEHELKDLNKLYLKSTVANYQQFSKIEENLLNYPVLADTEAFKANLNIKLSNEYPENNPSLEIDSPQTKNLLHVMSCHTKNDMSKWNLFNGGLIDKIFADPQLNLTNAEFSESDIKKIIGSALQLLSSHHDLKDTLSKRKQWEDFFKLAYATVEEVANFGQEIEDRITILEVMQDIKASEGSDFVYLPKDCKVIDNSETLTGACVRASGNIFQRRDELKVNETITYKQKLADEKHQIWSVTQSDKTTLEYRTPGKSNAWYKDFGATPEEVAFTQMIDAVNSFKSSKAKIIHFSFDGCSKDLEKKYRLFIRAYNKLNLGPKLHCKNNDTITMDADIIEEETVKVKNKLTLYNIELTIADKQLNNMGKDNTINSSRSRGL